jgi:tRNA (guanine37-N1)-methyltransferase
MKLFTVVTIFPEVFPGPLLYGLSQRALGNLWDLKTVNIRDFAKDKHRTVDDSPFGGGAGMILKPDVVCEAMLHALSFYNEKPLILHMTPRGDLFSQNMAREVMSTDRGVIILCGRYEGIDERVIRYFVSEHGMREVSIGDYVLFGGEIPTLVVMDVCLRLIPGIMNNSESVTHESFSIDLLEYPQYTRPAIWKGENVPSVLLSGNHQDIARWRKDRSEQITKDKRPDLWKKYVDRENV